jgi:hypothetical protein
MLIKIFLDWLKVSRRGFWVAVFFAVILVLLYFFPIFVSLLPFTYLGV